MSRAARASSLARLLDLAMANPQECEEEDPYECPGVLRLVEELINAAMFKFSIRISTLWPRPPLAPTASLDYERPSPSLMLGILEFEIGNIRLTAGDVTIEIYEMPRGRVPLNALVNAPELLHLSVLALHMEVTVSLHACMELWEVARRASLCVERNIFQGRPGQGPVEIDSSVSWPLGPMLPHFTSYLTAREALTRESRLDTMIDADDILWIPTYGEGSIRGLRDAVEGEGGLACRTAARPCNGRILLCRPVDGGGKFYGPFIVFEGSADSWDADRASDRLVSVLRGDAGDYAILPLAFTRSRPAMILPLNYSGPLGLCLARGTGVSTSKSLFGIHVWDPYGSGRPVLTLRSLRKPIVKGKTAKRLQRLASRIYASKYVPTAWTVFDTIKGVRPGPPLAAYEMIGFPVDCPL